MTRSEIRTAIWKLRVRYSNQQTTYTHAYLHSAVSVAYCCFDYSEFVVYCYYGITVDFWFMCFLPLTFSLSETTSAVFSSLYNYIVTFVIINSIQLFFFVYFILQIWINVFSSCWIQDVLYLYYLRQRKKVMFLPVSVCLSVFHTSRLL